jgi:hypothetical protein
MALHYFHYSNGHTILDRFGTDLPGRTLYPQGGCSRPPRTSASERKHGRRPFHGEPWKIW